MLGGVEETVSGLDVPGSQVWEARISGERQRQGFAPLFDHGLEG